MNFLSFSGTVRSISDFFISQNDQNVGCTKLFSVENERGDVVNFVVSPNTYFVDHIMIMIGDRVTGFYDADAPVPLIFPPQYRAIVMTKNSPYENVKVSFFNNQLLSSDGQLKLNLSPHTQMYLENGQAFTRIPTNRNLVVVYGPTTRSIPAQTTPIKIIVLCSVS